MSFSGMKILLRNSAGRYYAGRNAWSSKRTDAIDLKLVPTAIRINLEEGLGAAEVLLDCDNPARLLSFPIAEPIARAGL